MRKHPSYCCQKCGENVGYLGKVVEFIYYKIFRIKMFKHKCDENVLHQKELLEMEFLESRRRFWQNWSQRPEIQEVLYPEFNIKKRITKHKFIKNG